MERQPGTYALLLRASASQRVRIGRLGMLRVREGIYVYVGSAFGPGGVAARVAHHLRRTSSPHWHIDYLRRVARPAAVWISHDPVSREHDWAAVLAASRGAHTPLAGFGASDCDCPSHLFFFERAPAPRSFLCQLRSHLPEHAPVSATALVRSR